MNFESFLNEEITEKLLDAKIKQLNDIAKQFYSTEMVNFIRDISRLTDMDTSEMHEKIHEDMLDFIYELDSSGAGLKSRG